MGALPAVVVRSASSSLRLSSFNPFSPPPFFWWVLVVRVSLGVSFGIFPFFLSLPSLSSFRKFLCLLIVFLFLGIVSSQWVTLLFRSFFSVRSHVLAIWWGVLQFTALVFFLLLRSSSASSDFCFLLDRREQADQEIWPGEGVFFGLSTVIKFPANYSESPFSVIGSGVTCLPQRVRWLLQQ